MVDSPSLSRHILRREFSDLTSPQTKSASRQLLSEIRRKLDLRVPRRPRTFARLVRNRTTSKVSYHHAPLYGYAFSRIKSTPHHHSHALAAAPCQGQVTRASKPATLTNNHRTPKPPPFLTRLPFRFPRGARLVSRWPCLCRILQCGRPKRSGLLFLKLLSRPPWWVCGGDPDARHLPFPASAINRKQSKTVTYRE